MLSSHPPKPQSQYLPVVSQFFSSSFPCLSQQNHLPGPRDFYLFSICLFWTSSLPPYSTLWSWVASMRPAPTQNASQFQWWSYNLQINLFQTQLWLHYSATKIFQWLSFAFSLKIQACYRGLHLYFLSFRPLPQHKELIVCFSEAMGLTCSSHRGKLSPATSGHVLLQRPFQKSPTSSFLQGSQLERHF